MGKKIVDIDVARLVEGEREVCQLWERFREATALAYEWRDFETLADVVVLVEALKSTIHRKTSEVI